MAKINNRPDLDFVIDEEGGFLHIDAEGIGLLYPGELGMLMLLVVDERDILKLTREQVASMAAGGGPAAPAVTTVLVIAEGDRKRLAQRLKNAL